ncbi:hypothetical protein [Nocardia sp. NPDC052566]|uniref:hypothetical protein n=1 Tax=Nocardia sp. NPDC052566 TaxID=3364330 RepID=UPI0037CAB5BA
MPSPGKHGTGHPFVPWFLPVGFDSLPASLIRGLGVAMSFIDFDRRLGTLETRIVDVEECHRESILALKRHDAKTDIVSRRLIDGMNRLGSGMALMMERMGIAHTGFPELTMPTEEEIDAELEESS